MDRIGSTDSVTRFGDISNVFWQFFCRVLLVFGKKLVKPTLEVSFVFGQFEIVVKVQILT